MIPQQQVQPQPAAHPVVYMVVGVAEVSTRPGGGAPLEHVTFARQVPLAALTTASSVLFDTPAQVWCISLGKVWLMWDPSAGLG